MLFLASAINYIDRQVLSVVAPSLTRELNISPVDYANILQAFLIPYTLMYAGSGLLVDVWGSRRSLAIFMSWWSAANMLHALAQSAIGIGIGRFLLGLGEPGNYMAGFRAISEWYAPKERAFVNGLLNGGSAAGAILAPPLVATLTLHFGWRWAFVITGAMGFVWLLAWMRIVPPQPPPPVAGELAPKVPWIRLLTLRATWALLVPRFFSDPVWWFYLFWLPKYLAEQRGFSLVEIGFLAWMPYLAADFGALAGGAISGALVARGWPVLRARHAVMLPFALFAPVSILIPGVNSRTALALICLVTFAHMAWKTNLQTVTNDVFPASTVGSVSGLIACGSGLGGMLFMNLTGWTVQNFSYDAIFYVMGFLHPTAYFTYLVLSRNLKCN